MTLTGTDNYYYVNVDDAAEDDDVDDDQIKSNQKMLVTNQSVN